MQDAMWVTQLLNRERRSARLDPYNLSEYIISIGYRLLHFQPLDRISELQPLDRACHIGLAVYLSTLYIQHGSRRMLKYGLVGKCLRATIEACFDDIDAKVLLWVFLLGGPSLLAQSTKSWLAPKVLEVLDMLGTRSWSEVRSLVATFPWICGLHDASAAKFYEDCLTSKETHIKALCLRSDMEG
jgi:hypothetical protein